MTKREFMTAVLNDTNVPAEWKEYAEKELDAIERAAQKKAEKNAEKNAERQEIIQKIVNDILTEDAPTTATAISEIMEITPQKASALMRVAIGEGLVTKVTTKIEGQKGTRVGYMRAN